MDMFDYAVGADEDATAANIAAAINTLPGWTATSALHVVTVTNDHQADDVVFEVHHYGTIVNFTTLTPDQGFLALGNPTIGPPLLTP
jgi:hypothetical protein